MNFKLILIALIAVVFSGCAAITNDQPSSVSNKYEQQSIKHEIAEGLVEVMVTYQQLSPFLPWQRAQPHTRVGYGVAVDDSTIITTDKLVRNYQLVELRRARTGQKVQATVIISDVQAGLALLKIKDTDLTGWLHPVKLANSLPKNAKVNIYQIDETAQIQQGNAELLSVSVAPLPWSPFNTLAFKLLSNMSINANGAMAIYKGELAGIISSYNGSSRTATMIPYPVINHFLSDAKNMHYKGFASAGFFWTTLVDPAKRSYLGIIKPAQGILVLSVPPSLDAPEELKPNDVIMTWDGYSIDNMGYYEDEEFGRLAFPYLIKGKRQPGDIVPVEIIRDKAPMTVNVALYHRTDSSALIPDNITGEQVEYIVEGGLLFRELTGAYLMAHGGNWQRSVGANIAQLYMTRKNMPSKKGERVVILAGVLSDPINIGYQAFRNHIITHLNGSPVSNMDDVFKIKDRDKFITRIKLQFIDVELVLDEKLIEDANARLATLYSIPKLSFRRESEATSGADFSKAPIINTKKK